MIEEIQWQEKQLDALEKQRRKNSRISKKRSENAEEALSHAHQIIGDTLHTLDYLFSSKTSGTCKASLTHGFQVQSIFMDSISPEEKRIFWLKENYPEYV